MIIDLYTKPGCANCDAAKRLLDAKGLEYTAIDVETVLGLALFITVQDKYPEARQMPQIFIDGQRVGGLAGLQSALKQLENMK